MCVHCFISGVCVHCFISDVCSLLAVHKVVVSQGRTELLAVSQVQVNWTVIVAVSQVRIVV